MASTGPMRGGDTRRLVVVVPAFREEREVEESLHRLLRVLDTIDMQCSVVVVVDGSPDETESRARAVKDPRVSVVSYETNHGKGYALKHGCTPILDQADFVCFADADLDLNPSTIPTLLEILERDHADAVVGSKVHPDSVIDSPRFRRVQSAVFRLLVRAIFDLTVSDTQTGLKVFRREFLSDCLPRVMADGFAFDLELLAVAGLRDYKVVEGPVELTYHFATTTGLRAVRQVLADMIRVRRRVRAAARTERESR